MWLPWLMLKCFSVFSSVEGLDPDGSSCEECPLPELSPEIRITVKDEQDEQEEQDDQEGEANSKLLKHHTMSQYEYHIMIFTSVNVFFFFY